MSDVWLQTFRGGCLRKIFFELRMVDRGFPCKWLADFFFRGQKHSQMIAGEYQSRVAILRLIYSTESFEGKSVRNWFPYFFIWRKIFWKWSSKAQIYPSPFVFMRKMDESICLRSTCEIMCGSREFKNYTVSEKDHGFDSNIWFLNFKKYTKYNLSGF